MENRNVNNIRDNTFEIIIINFHKNHFINLILTSMKKIILTSLLTFAFGFTNAQNAKFGIKGGLNVANQSNPGGGEIVDFNTSSLIGFHIGGFVEIKISDKFSIQPELLYSAQGGKLNFTVLTSIDGDPNSVPEYVNTEVVNNLSYINIPVMFKYYVIEKFSLELGPQLGILVDSKRKMTNTNNGQTFEDSYNYDSIDYGLNLGAGYDITDSLTTGIRYSLGLYDIATFSNEVKNSVLSLSVSYKFE